ncbi:glycosyltransferase [Massilia sp. METH4]|uniref:glycosyltransferase family 2 protein n=1 Tax=Massilia sp. METH4 TaxID=3123041 RepID=UPI0030D2FF10
MGKSAEEFRLDLQAAGIGDGKHAFTFQIPISFYDGKPHAFSVQASCEGQLFQLNRNPITLCLSKDSLIHGDFGIDADGLLQGWVIDRASPSRTVSVDVEAEDAGHVTLEAILYRPDLLAMGNGSGKHGFQMVLPGEWYDRERLTIRVRESTTGQELGHGPAVLHTEASYFRQAQNDGAPAVAANVRRDGPVISILMPVYNPPPVFLEAAIHSVRAQSYSRWQLCIADDASPDPAIRKILEKHAAHDDRVRVVFREKNGHICRSSNSALALASGEFIALLDHDDLLHRDALLEVANVITQNPDVGMIFSDEDKCNENGLRYAPYRKAGWDPELLLGQNCISHLGVFRTEIVRTLGGFRPGYEGSQDYDLALRVSRALTSAQIKHIPRVLYHWRAIPGSTALANSEKSYAVVAMHKALRDHLRAIGSAAACEPAVQGVFCRVVWPLPVPPPSITVLMPFARTDPGVRKVIDAISALQWPRMQILAGNIEDADALENIESRREKYIQALLPAAKGDVCIWLEHALPAGSTEAWLRELASQALRTEIALVGAKLLDSRLKVAAAGISYDDPADPAGYRQLYQGLAIADASIGGGAGLCRTVQAITANTFAIRRSRLLSLLADPWVAPGAPFMTELSLRAEKRKWRTLLTPFAMSIITRALGDSTEKSAPATGKASMPEQ